MKRSLPICFLMLMLLTAKAQTGNYLDRLKQKLATYQRDKPASNLYVHIDKNNYIPGDTIWFKAYMLSALSSKVLYVRLTDDKKNIVLEKQFPVYDIRAHGDIALPDTLTDGKYFFYAFTDLMINFSSEKIFMQPIEVNANTPGRVEIEASVANGGMIRRGEKTEINLRVTDKGTPVKNAKGTYTLLTGDKMMKTGRINTNGEGETVVNFVYPQIADNQSLQFEAQLNDANKNTRVFLNLRHEGNSIKVNAYPEGGLLLEGVSNTVALETLDANKNPVSASLVLKEGEKETTIQTNRQGLGKIVLKPAKGVHYTFYVKENGIRKAIDFPVAVEPAGYSLKLERLKDQCDVLIYNKGISGNISLVLRSFDQVLWSKSFNITSGDSTRVILPAGNFPKEIVSAALFDPAGNPVAERLFMNKQGEADDYQIQISTTKHPYGKHDQVKVSLSIVNRQDAPVATNLSVAVIEKSTLNIPAYHTIMHSFYNRQLSAPNSLLYNNNAPDFDLFLISKNWGAYDWRSILAYQSKDSVKILANAAGVTGKITARRKRNLNLEKLLLVSKSGPEIITVDDNGYFYIAPERLTVNPNEKQYLLLNKEFHDYYEIKFLNYAGEFDKQIKTGGPLTVQQPFNTAAKYTRAPSNIFNGAIQLKEVVIATNGIDNAGNLLNKSQYGYGKALDFVCRNNILNCPNHGGGIKTTVTSNNSPVVGKVYGYYGHLIVYGGPGKPLAPAPPGSVIGFFAPPPPPPSSLPLAGINIPDEFYQPDYAAGSFDEPDIRTTVFWTPNLNTDATGKAGFEFYTSDIKSDYLIVVQGIDIQTLRPVYYTYNLKL